MATKKIKNVTGKAAGTPKPSPKLKSSLPAKNAVVRSARSKTKKSARSKKRAAKNTAGQVAVDRSSVAIKVFGVGGGGGNAISRMHESLHLRGVDLIGINTDAQELEKCLVKKKIHIGKNLTRGRGTGMNPELGRQAAEENKSEIVEAVKGADLVFITSGLGGGTGSGATPIVADAAKEAGALTVAIVTKPFTFEGTQRARVAEDALAKIRERVDALIVVPNDRVFNVIKKDTPTVKALERIDDILREAIAGISELISSSGIINVDFSDIQTIMREAGSTLIGVGLASGQNRAVTAASQAVNSPLLEFSIEGAQGILFGVSGGRDMKMSEINEIAKTITATIDPGAKIIFGAYQDRRLKQGQIKVTLIATGFSGTVTKAAMDEMVSVSDLFSDLSGEQVAESESTTPESGSVTRVTGTRGASAGRVAEINEPVSSKKPVRDSLTKDKSFAASATDSGKKELLPDDKKKEDLWEIPAFLRKKRRG
ncbi:MAG: cell division protein FtsZ [Candidatus Harrisonbacteria bacterium CG10_big_fil_rev_8_21_14_0_10_49_15]|uniref:Cell division protein FtsZ n=1 Tax=Candidatus Harrisonbacteria bacterium CG10_big_fil_rev_8_21_14_0_10_49_15 TaxID=1974587 RepID=A0A2H0ULZ5_9BACT|nr:MAG: cell division protein FtsZ [Candidatus Harrisonbacteria bacterium CG10_big_fil_rev_8_21_14_0_10_49_15]